LRFIDPTGNQAESGDREKGIFEPFDNAEWERLKEKFGLDQSTDRMMNNEGEKNKKEGDAKVALTANTLIGLSYTAKSEFVIKHPELFVGYKGINLTKSVAVPFKLFSGLTTLLATGYYSMKAINARRKLEANSYLMDAAISALGYYWPYGTVASLGYFLLKDYNSTLLKSPKQNFFIPDKTKVNN